MFEFSDLPLPAIRALRAMRATLLRVASPVERAFNASGRDLPPLWLRRHAGPVEHFESSALDAERLLVEHDLVAPGSVVVDLGCGPGAMAPVFARRLGAEGRYLGLDVHGPSIRWCRRRWAGDERFRFELLERDSPYRTARGASRGGFPVGDGGADLVIAKSLFTHVLEEECAALLAEIRRALGAPRGRAFVTAFLFDEHVGASYFRHPGERASVRWRHRHWPHAAVAYERGLFEFLAEANGLRVERFVAGYHPGGDGAPRGQDVLILAPRAG